MATPGYYKEKRRFQHGQICYNSFYPDKYYAFFIKFIIKLII